MATLPPIVANDEFMAWCRMDHGHVATHCCTTDLHLHGCGTRCWTHSSACHARDPAACISARTCRAIPAQRHAYEVEQDSEKRDGEEDVQDHNHH
jgi:hypothetical protein